MTAAEVGGDEADHYHRRLEIGTRADSYWRYAMTVDEVMQYRRAVPFRPFVLHLKDGRHYLIRQPEQIGRNPSMTIIGVAFDNGEEAEAFAGSLVDRVEIHQGRLPPLLRRDALV